VKWGGVCSVVIRPKPEEGGTVCSITEDLPESVDTGVGGSNPWVDMHDGKVQHRRLE